MAQLERIMGDGSRTGLTRRTMEDIRAIANQRFNELLEDGQEDIYIAAFFLDPRYRDAPILQNINDGGANPLAIPAVRIRFDQPGSRPSVAASTETSEQKRAKLVARIGVYLQGLLLREYGGIELVDRKDIADIMKIRNPLLASIPPLEALAKLKTELQAYDKGRAPYSRTLRPSETVLQWWERVHKDEDAQVLGALAIKIFSVVVNSMSDEQFMSVITWLNGPRRARQQVKTVSHYLTIRQYHLNQDPALSYAGDQATPRKVPALRRWCDLTANQRIDLDYQVSMDELGTGGGDDNGEPNLPGINSRGASPHESGSSSVPQNTAVDALYEGANMGPLDDERRSEFVVSDIFNLRSPFLREMLADDEEVAREQREARRATASMRSSSASLAPAPSGSSAPLPSQAAWGEWAAN